MKYEYKCRVSEGPEKRDAALKEMGDDGFRLVSTNTERLGLTRFYFMFFTKEIDA